MSVIQNNSITTNSVKPDSSQSLVLKRADDTASITVATNGEATFAENIIIGTAGKGITFQDTDSSNDSSTASEAYTLDSYETGTFTPVYRGSTTAGTYTYALNDGWYTKIGNIVHIIIGLYDITDSSEGSGDVEIAGLPFTSASDSGRTAIGGVFLSRWTLTGETYCSLLSPSTDYVQVFRPTSGASGTGVFLALTDRAADNSDIGISITYQVN